MLARVRLRGLGCKAPGPSLQAAEEGGGGAGWAVGWSPRVYLSVTIVTWASLAPAMFGCAGTGVSASGDTWSWGGDNSMVQG